MKALESDTIERAVVGDESSKVKAKEVVHRIILGVRGTWNDSTASGTWFHEKEPLQDCLVSGIFTWITDKLTPSNYGFSDFYYDAMLIRIPYRKGTVWKWYAYWGSLILERTRWAHWFFTWPRTVAGDWMNKPSSCSNEPNNGHVHLGFWSLWASPEGFAGYDREGCVSSETGVLQSIRTALEKINGEKAELYVVGHSLGGAVSSFAAVDIAQELKHHPNVAMYHVTFGSPPVGTAAFASYFSTKMGLHQSWNISHERDMIPQCFSWCASKWYLRPLNWWSDWSCIGEKRFIRKLKSPEPSVITEEKGKVGIIDKCKWGTAGLGALGMLYGLSVFAIPNPPKGPKNPYREIVTPLGENVGLEYHSLQRYIDLMEDENDLEI
ncbi:Alpha/Beta hydrolase protein [Dendryphion nanum]|uniref:Alpha/Beta hydrolase protein n=1 Tax=Dendryphion nanum TaxID=256645 RepID=A0A9P9IYM8_9PLEO|nr:Alpha/Beta hydrolase protein [Dendryphion nanum]